MGGCGVCLDPAEAQVAAWSGCPSQSEPCLLPGNSVSIPPAALVPRLVGEPVRADTFWPPHPRGSGQLWPPEARVRENTEGGRFPLAYAWSMLKQPDSPAWSWQEAGVRPAQAIACVWASLTWLARRAQDDSSVLTCLVIPNHLPQSAQQALLDAARFEGLQAKLLWRPVAAAMAWCRHFESVLAGLKHTPGHSVGSLLVLHLGLDEWEGTILGIVPQISQGRTYFLPARPRPHKICSPGSNGLDLLHRLAEQVLRASGQGADFETLWQLLWCTPWMKNALAALMGCDSSALLKGTPYPGSCAAVQPFREEWLRLSRQVTSRTAHKPGHANRHLPALVTEEVVQWRQTLEQAARQQNLLGAVVTGPMAPLALEGQPLGHRQARHIWPMAQRVLCEGMELPVGILALSAARYAAARTANLPTYLDTLPRLQVAVSDQGEPVWVDLLDDKQGFVDGGQVWRRSEPVKGLKLAAREAHLTLALNHEEYLTVRQVRSALPKAPERMEPICLEVSIEPAQGNARVEVRPADIRIFGHHRVYVDWDTMQNTGKAPRDWLEGLPRCFPDVRSRPGNPIRWQRSRQSVEALLPQVQALLVSHRGSTAMDRAIGELRTKSQLGVSSEGAVDRGQDLLDDLVAALTRYLVEPKRYGHTLDEKDVVRILGRTYTDHADFQAYLAQRMRQNACPLKAHELLAIGRCVRDPQIVQKYAVTVFQRLQTTRDEPSNWLKALSEILMHRKDAARQLSPDLGLSLSEHLIAIFELQLEMRNCNWIFRHSANAIVYLLRIRAFCDSYLDPNSRLAGRIKGSFEQAKRLAGQGRIRLLGGKKLEDELQVLIAYIDRKGIGLPGLADEEDDDEGVQSN